ncbi:MAG: hypothetical protein WBB30_04805 [Solirubrobacterales bacterium]
MALAHHSSSTVLAFLNEVAGGRKLLAAIRERVDAGAEHVVLAAPQNVPSAGQIVDAEEVRDAALSRVEVTQRVLHDFGIESRGVVLDPDPMLALDDGVRAFNPDEVLISCLPESRYGLMRKDLIEWAHARYAIPVEHIPVRIEDDAIRWDVTHTLVVATQTVNAPDLVKRLIERHAERPHRYTFICPASGDTPREEVCARLAATLAAVYRADIDATGQPMSPEPLPAVHNAVDHYRVDEVLISTFAGRSSKWLEDGLIDQVKEITDAPIEHIESGGGTVEPVAAGAGRAGAVS